MFFVGIDPSLSNTGVCVLDAKGILVSVGQSSKSVQTSPKKPAERLALLSSFVLSELPATTEVFIGYEDYSFDSVHRAFDLAELGGALKMSLYGRYKAMHLFAPSALKSFATGLGSAKKDLMMSAALEECPGLAVGNDLSDDLCDAYFLAMAAMYVNRPELATKVNTTLVRHRLTVINKGKYKEMK